MTRKEVMNFTAGPKIEPRSVCESYLWKKKIPVLYGNVLFKEHPEGQQQSPRLSATSMCPLQSNDWR